MTWLKSTIAVLGYIHRHFTPFSPPQNVMGFSQMNLVLFCVQHRSHPNIPHSTTRHSLAGVRSNRRVETVQPQGNVSPPRSNAYLATFTPHTRSIPSTFPCRRTLCACCSVSNPTLTPRKHAPNNSLRSPCITTDCTSLHRIHSTTSCTCLSTSIAHRILRRSHTRRLKHKHSHMDENTAAFCPAWHTSSQQPFDVRHPPTR